LSKFWPHNNDANSSSFATGIQQRSSRRRYSYSSF